MLEIERLLFLGGNHILFMNCINITCWKCVFISSWYHAAASRPALNEILMFPVVHLYPTESKKIRNSLKNGEMFTTEQLHDNEAVAPLRCVWDIFLDYPEIETAEINSELYTRKVKKQSCVLVVSELLTHTGPSHCQVRTSRTSADLINTLSCKESVWRFASSFNAQVCVFTFYLFIMGEEKPLIMQHFKLWQWNETLVWEVGTYRHFHVFWRRRASADVLIGCFFSSYVELAPKPGAIPLGSGCIMESVARREQPWTHVMVLHK